MFKSTICLYWENKSCRFMKNPEKCEFAHGEIDIKNNTVNCKYGIRCNNSECCFYHGNTSTIPYLIYDIPIFNNKRKNKKNKTDNKKINIIEKSNIKIEDYDKKLSITVEFYIKKYNTISEMVEKQNRKDVIKNILNMLIYTIYLKIIVIRILILMK